MANPTKNYVFALLHTVAQQQIEVLLVRRHLIQTLVDERSHRGLIPNWAGQWGVIAARPLVSQSMEETVQGAILAQTGIDLSDPASAERYRIVNAQPRTLTCVDNKAIDVLYLTFMPEGLRAFMDDAANHIAARKVRDGVIDALEIVPISQALTLIEPCAPPPEGWSEFVSNNRSRSRGPSPLGSGSSWLASQLIERTAMLPTAARQALQTLAACVTEQNPAARRTPAEEVRLTKLEIVGAHRHSSGLWYQTYAPGQIIRIRAVTTAPSSDALTLEWQGGEPDPKDRPDWRALPLDRLSAPGSPFSVRALLGGEVREARIAVVPDLLGVELSRAHTPGGGDDKSDSVPSGTAWVRAVLSPATEEAFQHLNWYGGSVDPNHPLDRRLVSLQEIASDGKGVAVEADRGLQ